MELERWKEEKEHGEASARGKLEAPLPKPVAVEGTAGDELDVDGDEHENGSDKDEEDAIIYRNRLDCPLITSRTL